MSDRLREALAVYADSLIEFYDQTDLEKRHFREIVAAARRFLALTETGPDYEAAARVVASSLADKLHDGHETEGPCAGCHSDARSIVDAALADYLTEESYEDD